MARSLTRFTLAMAIVLGCGGEPASSPDSSAEGGGEVAGEATATRKVAPPFSLQDLDGGTLTLEELRGKVVVVDFWATWCPPCIFQVPILNEVHAEWKDQDVVVVGVSVDTDGPEVVREFVAEHDVQYRILMGQESLARDYGAPGFPWMVVIRPDGTLDDGDPHVGLVEKEVIVEALERVSADS